MKISVTYEELENYIFQGYNTKVEFRVVDTKTMLISHKKKLLLLPGIKLKVQVISIKNSDVLLSYDGGFCAKGIIMGLVIFLRNKFPEQVSFAEQNQAIIHLANITSFEKFFDLFEIKSIVFQEDKMDLQFEIKTPINY